MALSSGRLSNRVKRPAHQLYDSDQHWRQRGDSEHVLQQIVAEFDATGLGLLVAVTVKDPDTQHRRHRHGRFSDQRIRPENHARQGMAGKEQSVRRVKRDSTGRIGSYNE